MGDVIRVTTYELAATDFVAATFRLWLQNTLATNYFVMFQPTPNGTSTVAPRNVFARVTADPNGTGDLAVSDGNYLELTRYDDGTAFVDWMGVIVVVESLTDHDRAGFQLRGVFVTALAAFAGTGVTTDTDASHAAAWVDPSRVVPFGGVRGGGLSFTAGGATAAEYPSGGVRIYPSSTGTLNFERYAPTAGSTDAVTLTTYCVEFGDEWDVKRAVVRGTEGGAATNVIAEYAHGEFGSDPRGLSATLWSWWDAQDESTFTLGGSVVAEWRDKSGNGHTLNVLIAGAPLRNATDANFNNAASVTFTNDGIKTTDTKSFGDFTVMCCYRTGGSVNSYETLGENDYTTGWALHRSAATAHTMGCAILEGGAPYGIYSDEFRDNDVHVIVQRRSGTARTLWIDGKIITTDTVLATATTAKAVSLGSRVGAALEMLADTAIAEFIVWEGALTDVEVRAQVDRITRKVRGVGVPITRTDAWLWFTGWTADDGGGDSWTGATFALGDGVTAGSTDILAAVGLGVASIAKGFDVYAISHPSASVTWLWHASADGGSSSYEHAVVSPTVAESRGNDARGVTYTVGARFGVQTASTTSTATTTHSEALWRARHETDTTLLVTRGDSAPALDWASWTQNVDLGAIMSKSQTEQTPVFRVTSYRIDGEFTGTTFDLTLLHTLATDYFVMIDGARGDSSSAAGRDDAVRVTQDPNGTGDLTASSASNVIRLGRDVSASGKWFGTITVVECLQSTGVNGFKLVDVKTLSCATTGGVLGAQVTTGTLNTSATVAGWRRCVPFGGPRGGGWNTTSSSAFVTPTAGVAFELTDRSTLQATRYDGVGGVTLAADFTVYVVEWGSRWQVQQARFMGATATGAGTYIKRKIGVLVDPDNTWLWASGCASAGQFASETWQSLALHLGTGAAQSDPEDDVSIALGSAIASVYAIAYVLTHPSLAVDWRAQTTTASRYATAVAIDAAVGGESYGETSQGCPFTLGTRFVRAWTYSSASAATGNVRSSTLQTRPTGEATANATRDYYTGSLVGWYEAVDFGSIWDDATADAATPGPATYLVVPDASYAGAGSWLSATSQAGGYAGSAVPSASNNGSGIAFQAGTPTGTTEFDYLVTMSGAVSRPTGNNAGFNIGAWAWRRSGESLYKSQNMATLLRAPNPVNTGASEYAVAVCYSSLYRRVIIARIASATSISVYYRDANASNTAAWSSTSLTVVDASYAFTSGTTAPGLEIVELPSGRLLLFYSAAGATTGWGWVGDVHTYVSDDGGLTWTASAHGIMSRTSTLGAVVSAGFGGQLHADTSGDWVRLTSPAPLSSAVDNVKLHTIVSPDRGNSWKGLSATAVSIYSCQSAANATIGSFPHAIVGVGDTSGTFLLAYLASVGASTITLSAASRDGEWAVQTTIALTLNTITSPIVKCLCFVRAADAIWLYVWVEGTDGSELFAHMIDPANALDSGGRIAMGPITGFAGTAKYIPYNMQAAWCGNHIQFAAGVRNPDATAYTTDPLKSSMFTTVIGQWDTRPLCYGKREGYGAFGNPRPLSSGTRGRQWHTSLGQLGPVADADADANTTWTYTTAGTGSKSWASDWSTLSATSTTGTAYFTDTGGTGDLNWNCWFGEFMVTASRIAAATATDGGIRFRPYSATAGYRYDFTIRMDTTNIVVYDSLGAVILATLASVPLNTTGIELRVAWRAATGQLQVSYRALGTSGETDLTATAILAPTGGGAQASTIVDVGLLATTASGTTSTFKFRSLGFCKIGSLGQLSSIVSNSTDIIGSSTSTSTWLVADGVTLRWGGSGVVEADAHTGNLEYTRGLLSFGTDSPRVYWESSSLAENSLVLDAGSAPKRWQDNAFVLVGTVDRTCVLEFNDADAWTSPAFRATLTADLWPDLEVTAISGRMVKLQTRDGSALPKRGEATDCYLRFVLAGSASGKTYAVLGDPDAAGWVSLDTTDDMATIGVTIGATVAVFGDRMVWHSDTFQRWRYARITFPSLSSGGTATGTHRLGSVIPGMSIDFDVPMDWVWRDSQQPNVSEVRTRGGQTWHYEEGPAQRVIGGRIVGDVTDRQRDELRGLVGKLAGYSVKPVALVVDSTRPAATAVYGRWVSGSSQDNAAWFQDTDGNWHTAGDLDVQIVEEA